MARKSTIVQAALALVSMAAAAPVNSHLPLTVNYDFPNEYLSRLPKSQNRYHDIKQLESTAAALMGGKSKEQNGNLNSKRTSMPWAPWPHTDAESPPEETEIEVEQTDHSMTEAAPIASPVSLLGAPLEEAEGESHSGPGSTESQEWPSVERIEAIPTNEGALSLFDTPPQTPKQDDYKCIWCVQLMGMIYREDWAPECLPCFENTDNSARTTSNADEKRDFFRDVRVPPPNIPKHAEARNQKRHIFRDDAGKPMNRIPHEMEDMDDVQSFWALHSNKFVDPIDKTFAKSLKGSHGLAGGPNTISGEEVHNMLENMHQNGKRWSPNPADVYLMDHWDEKWENSNQRKKMKYLDRLFADPTVPEPEWVERYRRIYHFRYKDYDPNDGTFTGGQGGDETFSYA